MYGFLFYIIAGIARFCANIILIIQDALSRNQAKRNNKISYTDHNGFSRLTETGNRFSASANNNGHWVWTDDNMNVVRDLSQEVIENKRKENYDFSVKHGYSTYLWMSPKWGQAASDEYGKSYKEFANLFKDPNEIIHKKHLPYLYKDIKNGDIYVVKILYSRWYKVINETLGLDIKLKGNMNLRYFVNPKTNEVVRPIDSDCLEAYEKNNINLSSEEMNIINSLTRENNDNFFIHYDVFEHDIYAKERREINNA